MPITVFRFRHKKEAEPLFHSPTQCGLRLPQYTRQVNATPLWSYIRDRYNKPKKERTFITIPYIVEIVEVSLRERCENAFFNMSAHRSGVRSKGSHFLESTLLYRRFFIEKDKKRYFPAQKQTPANASPSARKRRIACKQSPVKSSWHITPTHFRGISYFAAKIIQKIKFSKTFR